MGVKILIVEDEEVIRASISDALTLEGYECIQAESGERAIELLEQITPDLIISDIMMPGIDGYELFQRVKKNPSTMLTPFLFLTAKTDEMSQRKGMNFGADDYIKKPFKFNDLINSVKSRLKKKELIDSTIERLGRNIAKYVPHEFRTPLVAIIGNSNLYLDYKDNLKENEKDELINSINKSAYRLLERIERFLLYSELEVTPVEEYLSLVKNNLNVDPSLYNLKQLCKNLFECKDRISDIDGNFEPADLKIYERDLQFILKELIINACKFSEKGTKITVTGKKEGNKYF